MIYRCPIPFGPFGPLAVGGLTAGPSLQPPTPCPLRSPRLLTRDPEFRERGGAPKGGRHSTIFVDPQ